MTTATDELAILGGPRAVPSYSDDLFRWPIVTEEDEQAVLEVLRAGSMSGLAEEAPEAYKDVDRVVDIVHRAGIARKVARTRPLGVIKG